MRCLVDAQLQPALARRLAAMGHEAVHVLDLGLATAPDARVRDEARARDAVIFTKDEDFAVWRVLNGGPPVVWLRLGNTRRAPLLARVAAELPAILAALERGDTLIEVA